MRAYDQPNIDYINSLTEKDFDGIYCENNKELGYRIKIIFRGEAIIYQEQNRSMICYIYIGEKGVLFETKTIENWYNGTEISAEEKELLIQRIVKYLEKDRSTKLFLDINNKPVGKKSILPNGLKLIDRFLLKPLKNIESTHKKP